MSLEPHGFGPQLAGTSWQIVKPLESGVGSHWRKWFPGGALGRISQPWLPLPPAPCPLAQNRPLAASCLHLAYNESLPRRFLPFLVYFCLFVCLKRGLTKPHWPQTCNRLKNDLGLTPCLTLQNVRITGMCRHAHPFRGFLSGIWSQH